VPRPLASRRTLCWLSSHTALPSAPRMGRTSQRLLFRSSPGNPARLRCAKRACSLSRDNTMAHNHDEVESNQAHVGEKPAAHESVNGRTPEATHYTLESLGKLPRWVAWRPEGGGIALPRCRILHTGIARQRPTILLPGASCGKPTGPRESSDACG
jgi:hypothetical protein